MLGATAPDHSLDRTRVAVPFGGLLLCMLLASLDQTILATALPTIAGDLGTVDRLPWVVTAYLVTSTASTPLWGKAGDLAGRRRVLQAAVVLFLVGSVLSGLAQTLAELIAFRAIQGLGAGGLITLAMAVVADLVPPRERGRYQGYIGGVFALASIAGPLVGGALVDGLSWRWVFYVNVPIGVAAFVLVGRVADERTAGARSAIDYAGAVLLAAALSAVVIAAAWGGQDDAWGSPGVLGLLSVSLLLLAGFVVRERRAADPILPLRLLRTQPVGIVSAVLFAATCAFFAVIVFLPLFLQIVLGASAVDSGLLLLPLLLATLGASTIAGWLTTRTGHYKRFPVIGMALMTAGLLLLSTMGTATSRSTAGWFMALFGAGFGLVGQTLVLAIQNAVDRREVGTATATANLFRALGGTVGVALFGAVLTANLTLPAGLGSAALRSRPDALPALPTAAQAAATTAFADAITTVFLVAAPIAACGFLLTLALQAQPLRTSR